MPPRSIVSATLSRNRRSVSRRSGWSRPGVRRLHHEHVARHRLGARDEVGRDRLDVAGEEHVLLPAVQEHRRPGDVAGRGEVDLDPLVPVRAVPLDRRGTGWWRAADVGGVVGREVPLHPGDLERVPREEVGHRDRHGRGHDRRVREPLEDRDHPRVVEVRVGEERRIDVDRRRARVRRRVGRRHAVVEQ